MYSRVISTSEMEGFRSVVQECMLFARPNDVSSANNRSNSLSWISPLPAPCSIYKLPYFAALTYESNLYESEHSKSGHE